MKKILVIDGNSIINRAFYGVRPLTTKSGKPTNAIYGMIGIIHKQLEAVKPDYAAVAFDLKHPTFRHEMYEGYKVGRHPTPPDLLAQFDDAKECLSLMGIKVLGLPGWEADDIQGTVAKMAHTEADTEAYVLSGDRDLLQLIDERVTVLLATTGETIPMNADRFREKYGVEVEEFVDLKALMGDSSDNIPGVGGVGEKTAANLIREFHSLEGIYENIEDKRISRGVREKLIRDKDNAFLSRRLAKIDTDAPVGITLSDIAYTGPDKGGLYAKLSELELNSVIVKLGLDRAELSETRDPALSETEYKRAKASEIFDGDGRVALEIRDTGVYIATERGCFILDGDESELGEHLSGREVICYCGKPLWHTLTEAGVSLCGTTLLDLELYEYVINPGGGSAGVTSLAAMFIGKAPSPTSPAVQLYFELEAALRERVKADGLEKILFELEIPLLPVLGEMERTGFKIDVNGINEFGEALEALAAELAERIYATAGERFNLNSPKQLGEILYGKLGLSTGDKKKKPSTDAQTLEEMRHLSPIIDDILEYRQVTKLRGTYTTALTEAADDRHRLHTDFRQALTATGRLSSQDPNLQNIPIKTNLGRQMRRFFIAEEGYSLVDADYSQIELRLLAHISDDYNMQDAFIHGEDIHRKTAAAVFGVPEDEVTEEMRKRAKAVNFGIVYGIGGYSLSRDIGSTVAEATRYIKNYLMNYPFIDAYLEDVVRGAEELGYTKTPMGRRRYIPELRSAKAPMRAFGKRVAMNAPIQGAAADIMKLAMLKCHEALISAGVDAKIVMQVHDELIVEARDGDVARVKAIIKETMEGVVTLSVPLTADVTSGKNWLDQE